MKMADTVRFAIALHAGAASDRVLLAQETGARSPHPAQARHEASPGTAFLGIAASLPIAACDCTLELEDTAGSKMRVHLKAAASPP